MVSSFWEVMGPQPVASLKTGGSDFLHWQYLASRRLTIPMDSWKKHQSSACKSDQLGDMM